MDRSIDKDIDYFYDEGVELWSKEPVPIQRHTDLSESKEWLKSTDHKDSHFI